MEPALDVDRSSRRHIDGLGDSSFEEDRLLIFIRAVEDPYCMRLPSDNIEPEDAVEIVSAGAFFAHKGAVKVNVVALHAGLNGHRSISRALSWLWPGNLRKRRILNRSAGLTIGADIW